MKPGPTKTSDQCLPIDRKRKLSGLTICSGLVTVTQIFVQARGAATASAHEVDLAHCRVPIGYAFVGIVIKLKICHIYKSVLRTI
jgi:hypothetical protein